MWLGLPLSQGQSLCQLVIPIRIRIRFIIYYTYWLKLCPASYTASRSILSKWSLEAHVT